MRTIDDKRYSRIDISEVNALAAADPAGFITDCEEYYNAQVQEAARQIATGDGAYQFVLLCGPSASGKTTTAHKLKHRIQKLGNAARVVSMDNFFTGMKNYPLLEDGTPNMESIEAMNLELLNSCFEELFSTGESHFPVFDFVKQEQKLKGDHVVMQENEIIIMEGIHALNPAVLQGIPGENIFRIYASVRTRFLDGDTEVLNPGDIRLLRRMVRDHKFRSYSPLQTLEYWRYVRDNERVNMYPYRDDVDLKMDNTLDYEVCVWKELLGELLGKKHKAQLEQHEELAHIFSGLLQFEQMSVEGIPSNSLLREFIGKRV